MGSPREGDVTDSAPLCEHVPESCSDLLGMSDMDLKSEIPRLARDGGRMGEIEQAVNGLPSHHELYQGDARDLSMIEDESVHLPTVFRSQGIRWRRLTRPAREH